MPEVKKYSVVFQKSAFKEYGKLNKTIKKKIDEALEILSFHPMTDLLDIKKMRGIEGFYRIRVGEYRMIYTIVKTRLLITVIRIGHRGDVYRHF